MNYSHTLLVEEEVRALARAERLPEPERERTRGILRVVREFRLRSLETEAWREEEARFAAVEVVLHAERGDQEGAQHEE